MQQPTPPIESPKVESDYEPEPESLAGFFLTLSDKVDELLSAANWQPRLE